MGSTLKYLETIELPSKVLSGYVCQISENGSLSIITTSALYVYQICPLKSATAPILSIKKYIITPSDFMLCTNVGLDVNTFLHGLPQKEFYEAVLNTELSSKLNNGASVEQKIIQSLWSPAIIDDYDCVLASLSNTGCLELMSKALHDTYEEYKSIFNLTSKYTDMCRSTWKTNLNSSALDQYNELKYRVKETLPTAFTWSDKVNNGYCILIVGHDCGDISFWKINQVKSRYLQESDVTFINVVNANLASSTSLKWISLKDDNALLLIGNRKGQITCLKMANKDQLTVKEELKLWIEDDSIQVKDIKFLTYLHSYYLIFVKGNNLIIFLIDKKGKIADTTTFHAENITITGLEIIGKNKLIVTCLSGALKEILLNCIDSKIKLEWRHFYVNINWYIYHLSNFVVSRNKMLFFFLTGPCKTADSKDEKDLNHLIAFINTTIDPLQIMSNNKHDNLRNYWDCLEAFRCQSIMDKQIFNKSIKVEHHYDNYTLYQLRLILWISKLSEIVYEQTGNINLSIKSYDEVYHIFNIKMAINRIVHLLKQYKEKNDLTEFQLCNIFILNCYLKQVVNEDLIVKFELSENMVTLLFNIISKANAVKYTSVPDCLYCGEKLLGTNCFPPHFDMRCSISFMQIKKYPDYKCWMCGSVGHTELETELGFLICPYCDIPMPKRL